MVNDLRQLLHANVAAPPHEDDDLARVLALGRRRVRRRLAAVVTGSALGIALVTAGAVAIPRLSHHGPQPVHRTKVVHAEDAVPAKEGKDYRVIRTLTGTDAEQASDVGPDGVIVVGDRPVTGPTTYSLLDPQTMERTALPQPDGLFVRVEAITWDFVYLSGSRKDGGLGVVVYDRRDGTNTAFDLPDVPALQNTEIFPGIGVGGDGRIYFMTSVPGAGSLAKNELWSVTPDQPAKYRREVAIGAFAVHGNQLAWTDPPENGAGPVHLRDLDTGAESSLEVPGYSIHRLFSNGDELALDAYPEDGQLVPHARRTPGRHPACRRQPVRGVGHRGHE
jgi:hypothetical protein